MKKNYALTSLLIVALSATAVSCGGSPAGTTDTTASSGEDNTTDTTAGTVASDEDELEPADFGGRVFKVLSAQSTAYKGYLDVEESNGDVLNDAIYSANRKVEERFNIKIEQEAMGAVDANNAGAKILTAGDHEYDIISLTDRNALAHAVDGLLISYADMPNIDLTKDYWCKSINDSMTIGGNYWLAYGDFNMSVYDYTFALAYNKKLAGDLKITDLYKLVDEGKWTFDVFNKYCIQASVDLNGDTQYTDVDQFGWSAVPKQISPTMWVAAGANSIKKDKDDIPYFSMKSDEFFNEVYQKIVDISWKNNAWYQNTLNGDITKDLMFSEGRALFQTTSFGLLDTAYYREMKLDYGILPHPKWDESQSSYYSRVEGGRIFAIPMSTPDTAFTGTILEALSYQWHKDVIPAYFEIALKTKYTRDDESSKMFDLIMSTRVYDLGDTFWCSQIRDGFVYSLFKTGGTDLSSSIASNQDSVEAAIAKTVDALK